MTRPANIQICVSMAAMLLWLAVEVDAQPAYRIIEVSLPGQQFSNLQGVSSNGQFAIGTSDAGAIAWTPTGGTVALPGIAGRPFQLPQSVNDSGIATGFGASTFFGADPAPGTWNIPANTSATLPLPAGETIGRAFGINNAGAIVGTNANGRVVRYSSGGSSLVTETFADGGVLTSAFGISNSGRVVGSGRDPGNAAITRAFYLDDGDGTATDIGALVADFGHNSAIAFDVAGDFIAGSSSFNSGVNVQPFLWEDGVGMSAIDLLPGTTTGGADGVNANGWTVGTMASTTSIIFLNDGSQSYSLQELLINNGLGEWDLTTGTSNAALGIADNGTIVGRALLNGQITGFVAVQIPEPGAAMALIVGTFAFSVRRRRR